MDSASFTCRDCESSKGMREWLLCSVNIWKESFVAIICRDGAKPSKAEQGWASDGAQLAELCGKECVMSGPTRDHDIYSLYISDHIEWTDWLIRI